MYREQGNVIVEGGKKLDHWDKNRFPLGWDKLSVEAFAEAEKVANQVWEETHDEEEAIEAGIEAARKYSEDKNVKLFV